MGSPNDTDLSRAGADGTTMTNIDSYRIRRNMIEGWVCRILLVTLRSLLQVLGWKGRTGIALERGVHGVVVFLGNESA